MYEELYSKSHHVPSRSQISQSFYFVYLTNLIQTSLWRKDGDVPIKSSTASTCHDKTGIYQQKPTLNSQSFQGIIRCKYDYAETASIMAACRGTTKSRIWLKLKDELFDTKYDCGLRLFENICHVYIKLHSKFNLRIHYFPPQTFK